MAVVSKYNSSNDDPLLPWLSSIKEALDTSGQNLENFLEQCIINFKDDDRYRDDIRFLKIWILYADAIQNFDKVFATLQETKIGISHSLWYISYAVFLEAKGKLVEADGVYRMGISRNAQPVNDLKGCYAQFFQRLSKIVDDSQVKKVDSNDSSNLEKSCIDPWSLSTIKGLLRKIDPQMLKYNGYHVSAKKHSGKIPLSSLHKSSRNKIVDIGSKKYQIKGCSGQGGFAQVFKALVNSNPDDVVALKIQKPPFPWEFYMYRLLDERIPEDERSNFAFAHKVHIFSDYSVLVCDYLGHGTLQDAINASIVVGGSMEEVLCIYYSIEMLRMLENLHRVGIIHGDYKPDNLLIRYARDDLTEDGFHVRTGPWRNQGLCLIDWGKGIDVNLFPEDMKFKGDCRTSGFRCIEMQEKKLWKFQVDIYGLCVVVHMMLHGTYMAIEKAVSPDGSYLYQTKSSLKR
ncbi:hypothetical protein GIB67_037882 [Kingdonia uniflora]|uniref:Mitotic checkpoint serine/threonine-protein kinase BUB1 n=1 Tax=Kingdonia uniflora TaxID=39325 RepID=A0A7J7LHB6_9MAGN|nr:hypothetical protein GIB67_037882 [Kingdonia uniflora]